MSPVRAATLVFVLLCASIFVALGSQAVEDAYAAVAGAVSPGGGHRLTREAVRSLFNTLEDRVQCGGGGGGGGGGGAAVSCEKVQSSMSGRLAAPGGPRSNQVSVFSHAPVALSN